MATIRKRGKTWRAEVSRQGVRKSESFPTKAKAQAWATKIEADIFDGKHGNTPNVVFTDLLQRYSNEVSIHKRSCTWEQKRLAFLMEDELATVPLPSLAPEHFAAWRDRRLREVSPATILRDWNLLTHAINVAINEWGWLKSSPLKTVKRPTAPLPRTRRISEDEIDRLCYALGYDFSLSPETATARVAAAMLFAIETAMRAGEIVALTWEHTNTDQRTVHIPKTKNGHPRTVPLSKKAIKIIEHVGQVTNKKDTGKSVV